MADEEFSPGRTDPPASDSEFEQPDGIVSRAVTGTLEENLAALMTSLEEERGVRAQETHELRLMFHTLASSMERGAAVEAAVTAAKSEEGDEAKSENMSLIEVEFGKERAAMASRGDLPSQLRAEFFERLDSVDGYIRADMSSRLNSLDSLIRGEFSARFDTFKADLRGEFQSRCKAIEAHIAPKGGAPLLARVQVMEQELKHIRSATGNCLQGLATRIDTLESKSAIALKAVEALLQTNVAGQPRPNSTGKDETNNSGTEKVDSTSAKEEEENEEAKGEGAPTSLVADGDSGTLRRNSNTALALTSANSNTSGVGMTDDLRQSLQSIVYKVHTALMGSNETELHDSAGTLSRDSSLGDGPAFEKARSADSSLLSRAVSEPDPMPRKDIGLRGGDTAPKAPHKTFKSALQELLKENRALQRETCHMQELHHESMQQAASVNMISLGSNSPSSRGSSLRASASPAEGQAQTTKEEQENMSRSRREVTSQEGDEAAVAEAARPSHPLNPSPKIYEGPPGAYQPQGGSLRVRPGAPGAQASGPRWQPQPQMLNSQFNSKEEPPKVAVSPMLSSSSQRAQAPRPRSVGPVGSSPDGAPRFMMGGQPAHSYPGGPHGVPVPVQAVPHGYPGAQWSSSNLSNSVPARWSRGAT
mmetsp:Transcript_6553/g.14314  ORF Transcript_6553/g.14314 Transcript_6553/m.14314 type:complete len:647 (-) Transcript_6553:190-2130(-)